MYPAWHVSLRLSCSLCKTVENKSSRIVKLSVHADISSARQIVKAILSCREKREFLHWAATLTRARSRTSFSSLRKIVFYLGKVTTCRIYSNPQHWQLPFERERYICIPLLRAIVQRARARALLKPLRDRSHWKRQNVNTNVTWARKNFYENCREFNCILLFLFLQKF